MPWSNQGGGSGGSGGGGGWKGGGGPWGQGPGGSGKQPDLEDLLKRTQDRMKQVMPGGSGVPGPLLLLIGAIAAALVAYYAFFFTVRPDEVGVVLRFGAYHRFEEPGLHFRWPYPIEEVRYPKVTRQNTSELGFRSTSAQRGYSSAKRKVPEESLMLTGDENIVDVEFVVFWKIKTSKGIAGGNSGVEDYLFNIQNPDSTVKEVAESAMREIVGQSNIQSLLAEGRQKAEEAVHVLIQKTLDNYGAGVSVEQVKLQTVDPPKEVIDASRDVQAARADLERLQNEANSYANSIVPQARGDAERILQAAEGYRQQTIAEATGQAGRFLKIFEEYKKAPEVTRKRMFLETMERVMSGTDKIILDNRGGGQGVVPFLPLDQLQKKKEGAN